MDSNALEELQTDLREVHRFLYGLERSIETVMEHITIALNRVDDALKHR